MFENLHEKIIKGVEKIGKVIRQLQIKIIHVFREGNKLAVLQIVLSRAKDMQ